MFKRLLLIPAIIVLVSLLASSPVVAQSREDATHLHNEAKALIEKAKSKEVLKQAEGQLLRAITIYQNIGDRKRAGSAYNDLGSIYGMTSRYEKAAECFEKSIVIARDLKDGPTESTTLNNLAIVYQTWGQYDKAKECCEKSLAIRRSLKDRKGEGHSLKSLGIIYMKLGQYDMALEYCEKSIAISRELKDGEGEGSALIELGNICSNRSQYQKAVEYYEKSSEIMRKVGNITGEGIALNNLGLVYEKWQQGKKAMECFEKALEMARTLGAREEESDTLINLGMIYSDSGQFRKALEHYEKALGIKRKLGDLKGEGTILNNLGALYKNWGQWEMAEECWTKGSAIFGKLGNLAEEGNAAMNVGRVRAHRGELEAALKAYRKGLDTYSRIGIPINWPKALVGDTYMDMGDLAKAEPLLKEANYNSLWGRFYLLKADYPKAKEYYAKILKSAEENRNADSLFTGYTGMGLACEGVGDDPAAAEHFEKAIQLTEEIRSSLTPNQRETFFDVKIKGFYRTAPYEGLARVMIKLNRPLDAVKWSEYTKARLFAESISRRRDIGAVGVPQDVLKKDEELNDQLGALKKNGQTAYEKNNKEQIAALEPQIKDLESKLASHVKSLREKYPLFAATKYPEPMDLSQTALRPEECTLAYDVTDPGLIIYLTKGKELKKALFKPIPRKDVDALVRKFRQPFEDVTGDNIAQKVRAFDFAAGKQLNDLLLSEVLPEIPKGTPLIIIPDDSLGAVPFEMLVLNQRGKIADSKGRPNTMGAEFFGDRNPISYYQSITALTLARNFSKQKGSETKRLVMSDPIFDAQDQRLKDLAAQQKQNLMKELPQQLMSIKQENKLEFPRLPATGDLGKTLKEMDPTNTELCVGFDASKPALFKKPLDKYGSVVFATHGYFGKELAGIQEPVLVLTQVGQPKGQDGFLRLSEVMGLKLNADIVALTACQTGLGRHISGEGTMGMGRAFQYAGAKSVLMSLWSVSEAGSVKLVESFFRHLKEGKNKLEALKVARDEIRKEGYDHPFYWAPFILVGEVN